MNRATKVLALSSVFAFALSLAPAQEYTLKMNPKEGDTFKYRMSMDIDFGGMSVNASTTITNKVLKIEENGNIVIESTSSELVVKFGDTEMPQPGSPPTRVTYKPNGEIVSSPASNSPTNQLTGNTNFIFPDKPVKVGDKWTHTTKGQNGAPDMKGEFELVGVEKMGDTEVLRLKVSWTQADGKADGINIDGFILIDPTNGIARRLEFKVKGLPVEGAPGPIGGTLRMEQIS